MIRVALLTVSDGVSSGARSDDSGEAARRWSEEQGWSVVERDVVPDEMAAITRALFAWADREDVDVILTLGGTGLGPRDVTPEATASVLDRPAPGIAEALRADGLQKTPYAMIGRGLAGARGDTLIVNLPGSERAVRDGLALLQQIVPHAVDLLAGRTEHGR